MKEIAIFLLLLLFTNCEAQTAKLKYTANRQYVVDKGQFFTASERAKLNEYLQQLDEKTLVQVLLYTQNSLEGKVLKNYTLKIAEDYGIGYKGINNGIGIFLFKQDRKARIEVGFGMEWILSDSISQEVMNVMIPLFKQDKFYEGLRQAFKQIVKQNKQVAWDIYDLPKKLSKADNQKIFKVKYSPKNPKSTYLKPSLDGKQFSDNFKIPMMFNNQTYNLYYTKYMGNFISKIQDNNVRTIWFRLIDYDTKKLELLGVE